MPWHVYHGSRVGPKGHSLVGTFKSRAGARKFLSAHGRGHGLIIIQTR